MEQNRLLNRLDAAVDASLVEVRDTVTSTNDLLKEAAGKGAAHGTVMVAGQQTRGKGRSGRSFYSPEETGLYLSVLLRPSVGAKDALAVTTMAAVCAAEAIEVVLKEHGEDTSCEIKWVNDLLLGGKKIAGILTEGCFTGREVNQGPEYLIMGIGFNVYEPENGFPEEIREIAGPILKKEMGKIPFIREELAASFINAFLSAWEEYETTGIRTYMDGYRRRSCVLGKTAQMLNTEHLPIEGAPLVNIVGIGDEAELIVEYPDGHLESLSSGEVSIRTI